MKYELPDEVLLFITAAIAAGYRCEVRKRGVHFRSPAGVRIGKYNAFRKTWAIYKGISNDRQELMTDLDFCPMEKAMYGGTHRWWQLDGADRVSAYQEACEALTGVPILGIRFHQ